MNDEVPLGWSKTTLQHLIERKFTGPSPTCDEREIASADEWGLLKTTAVTWDGWDESAHKVPPRSYWGNRSIEVRRGDVLITKAGPRHRVGVVVHVANTRPRLMVSGKMVGLRPNTSVVVPSVLASLLSMPGPQDFLDKRTSGMAESQTNFSDEALLSTPLIVPSMPEQLRIAEMLGALDKQIHDSAAIGRKLDTVRDALVSELVSGLPDQTITHLGSVLQLPPKNGYSPIAASSPTGSFMLGLGCLTRQGFVPRQLKYAPQGDTRLGSCRLADGDLLMSRSNTRDLVGLVGIYRDIGSPCFYPDLMMRLVPTPRVTTEFLSIVLGTAPARRQIMNSASGTSGSMVKVSGRTVRQLKIPVPDMAVQARIVDEVEALRSAIRDQSETTEKLRKLRTGLALDLLSGGVRVRGAQGR